MKKRINKIPLTIIAGFLAFALSAQPFPAAATATVTTVITATAADTAIAAISPPETAIVWVADVSGSIPECDPQRYWSDAV